MGLGGTNGQFPRWAVPSGSSLQEQLIPKSVIDSTGSPSLIVTWILYLTRQLATPRSPHMAIHSAISTVLHSRQP